MLRAAGNNRLKQVCNCPLQTGFLLPGPEAVPGEVIVNLSRSFDPVDPIFSRTLFSLLQVQSYCNVSYVPSSLLFPTFLRRCSRG